MASGQPQFQQPRAQQHGQRENAPPANVTPPAILRRRMHQAITSARNSCRSLVDRKFGRAHASCAINRSRPNPARPFELRAQWSAGCTARHRLSNIFPWRLRRVPIPRRHVPRADAPRRPRDLGQRTEPQKKNMLSSASCIACDPLPRSHSRAPERCSRRHRQ